jgi:hypothetical protein
MIAPVYLTRILNSFPHEFTDDTTLDYISIKFETVFIVPSDGNYTFYVIVSKNSKVDVTLTIDNSLFGTLVPDSGSTNTSTKLTCGTKYAATSCCLDTEQTFNMNISFTAGDAILFEL